MWSAVVVSVSEATSATARPAWSGTSTTAAAASENRAWATTCCGSTVGGWTCRLVNSTHSNTAGRPFSAT